MLFFFLLFFIFYNRLAQIVLPSCVIKFNSLFSFLFYHLLFLTFVEDSRKVIILKYYISPAQLPLIFFLFFLESSWNPAARILYTSMPLIIKLALFVAALQDSKNISLSPT